VTTAYTCRICDPYGSLLAEVANFVDNPDGGGSALGYTLNVGNIGALRLTLPITFDASLLRLDGRVGVWRAINGRAPTLDGQTVFFIRKWEYTDRTTTITAYSANHLRTRRVIDYFAGSSYASKAAPTAAGNVIKIFVSENMLAGIVGADRQGVETQADISAYLTNQADLGDGQSIAQQCAWRNLDDVIREIQDASTFAGTYMACDIIAPSESTLELRTYATVRGVDHTATSMQPMLLSPQAGSLENCRLIVDRSEEVTFAVAGGAGEQSQRLIATAIDTARVAESPFNRIERFGDYSNISDAAALQDVADAMVRAGRPRIEFTADVIETDGATRGIQYDLGDMVTASFRNVQYDCRMDVVEVAVGGGAQISRAKIRSLT
jgi:Siphovirus ReqiPepy6 Gp37-like protein